ncbi:MAG: NADH-ubiquinone oxidoreductase-F iron-sulfur binding region domain-containing protein [Acidimicrobiales bacterium]
MTLVHRVLYPRPILSLDEYVVRGGGKGIAAADRSEPAAIIEKVLDSGLRGRGGAGFLTGRKWETVAANQAAAGLPATVVVNAAEGEPGTLKDRTILRRNPYVVLEGALVAARAVGADLVVVATKRAFEGEIDRMRDAIDEAEHHGWSEGIDIAVFEGPDEYLYGEESALLETLDRGWPFPRVVPVFRRGTRGGQPEDAPAPPALVNNTETMANVARIVARGPAWFRTVGTQESPGTVVCTVTGDTRRAGVGEVRMGTPLGEVIEAIGGGPRSGRRIKAVLSGVANAVIPASKLDTPVSYEGMASIGSGLGSCGFIVFDDTTDMASVAAGVARFLGIESCGQCSPCKLDGMTIATTLEQAIGPQGTEHHVRVIRKKLANVADRSRCFLATQHQVVVSSILEHFQGELDAHIAGTAEPVAPALIAELVDIHGGRATVDERFRRKQPDWSYNKSDSGTVPVERYADQASPWRLY